MMKLKIKRVDHDGYCGRDFHPDTSDEGLVVTVVKMQVVYADDQGTEEDVVGTDGRLYMPALSLIVARQDSLADGTAGFATCYTCVAADGRVLDLMDHEVEEVR